MDTVQNILKGAEIKGHTLKLNCGDLDRDTYQKVDEVLKRLWGKWKGRQRVHEFTYDPTDAIAEYVASGALPPKNATAYFPTPSEVIEDMLCTVRGCPQHVLEPSAGQGAIADACTDKWEDVQVCCVGCLDINSAILKRKKYNVWDMDFLDVKPWPRYDLAAMNPPFSVAGDPQAYMTHIYHAFKFLKPGGANWSPLSPKAGSQRRGSGSRSSANSWPCTPKTSSVSTAGRSRPRGP